MTSGATLAAAARGGVVGFRRGVQRWGGLLRSQWRRSLQLRVVTATMAISLGVVAVLGFFLLQQISQGLLRAKENAALTEAYASLTLARNHLSSAEANGTAQRSVTLDRLTSTLARRSGPSGLYELVVLTSARGHPQRADVGRATGAVSPSSIPQRLRAEVRRAEGNKQHYAYAPIHYEDGTETAPGFIVGASLGSYQLYHLFPLTQEAETLAFVRSAVVAVGVVLVLLLAGIASLLTRQVVMPVRLAAGSAERLARGNLEERMRVRGEDDLARLGSSFNQMAKSLQEKIQQLEELSRVQRQFVSDVSHELRTPLTTVRIAADVLYENRDDFDDSAGRSAELLQHQLERFEALLNDLLEISRYDAGAATLDADSVDLRDTVMRAVGDTEQLAERRDIRVVLRLPGEACLAEIDTRRVERVLRNLIVNAIEHGEGHDIIVTVAGDRDAVAVGVRDYGVGLQPREAAQVFDRFWRADPARARGTGGTGLGLSIAREDAALHGGWLQAWGAPGKGSQFRLSLPRVTGQELRGSPLPLVPPEVERDREPVIGYGELAPLSPGSVLAPGDWSPAGTAGGPRALPAGPAASNGGTRAGRNDENDEPDQDIPNGDAGGSTEPYLQGEEPSAGPGDAVVQRRTRAHG